MAGPRKGLYDDRPKEELMAPITPTGPYPPVITDERLAKVSKTDEFSGVDYGIKKSDTILWIRHGNVEEVLVMTKTSDEDLEYWIEKFRKVRIELEQQDIPYNISPKLRKAEIDGLKSIEEELRGSMRSKDTQIELPLIPYIPPEPWLRTQKQQAKYEAQAKIRAELRAERKKRKVYKVITVVCKVITGFLLIYIGLIIMENILAGKPISTYLNRVLSGE